jgi:hypothetical protein
MTLEIACSSIICLHHIMSRSAVNVKINETRREEQTGKIQTPAGRNFAFIARSKTMDSAILYHHNRRFD